MSVEENIATIRSVYERANRDKNFDSMNEAGTPSYTVHIPGAPPMDIVGMENWTAAFFAAIPDLKHDVVEIFSDGDRAALRLRIHGKHTAPLVTPMGTIPASNNPVDFEAINIMRLDGGKVAEHWISFDMMTVMHQLGAMPG